MRKGRIDEAIAAYQRSIELDPLSASPRTNLAALYEIIGRMDDALQLLERVVVIDPQGIRGQSALAVHYATARGRLDQGVLWASRAVTNDPQNPRFQFYMAVFYMALGDFDTATAWLRALGSLNTDDFRQTRGHLYLAMVQGDAQRAQELANQIFEHYSSGDRDQLYLALVNLRDVDIRAGRFADALARFETLFPELTATQSPDLEAMLVTIIEDLAYLHLHSGNDARARQLLELAIPFTESQPILGRGGSRYGNARAYALLGRNEAALEDLQRGVKAGWRMNWRLVFDYDPILEPLRDEPRFQELRELINADMEEQLESVRQLEASGDVLRPEAFARRSEQNPQGRVR